MAAVLVVEDDPELGDVLASLLEDAGHDVALAGSLEEARNALEGATPSVVLADWNVPGGGAPELLRLLAEERLRVPVIAMTGMDVSTLDGRGFAAMLGKPFTTDKLLGLLSSLVDVDARAPA